MREAAQKLRNKNQAEIADLIEKCTTDIQSSHLALQKETQALLQATAPALLKNVELTLQNCETKLAEMTDDFESKSNGLMHSALAQMDQEISQQAAQLRVGERLIQTIKSELPEDLKTPARDILMAEVGPIWMQRWMIALITLMLCMMLILGTLLYSAQRAKTRIMEQTTEFQFLQEQISEEQRTLTALSSQTMGITFYRMKDGMALKLPETLRLKRASVDVRNALGNPSRRNLYWITER